MKRLVVCFDGTWNRLDAPHSTNVVLTAESVVPQATGGVTQAIFYDDGVGTRAFEKITGGVFGHGLVENMGDAYRFLIFNYMPGDEIYIFGFSRGAFTARSFAGLLSTCGILRRSSASKVTDAIKRYQGRDKTDGYREAMMQFRQAHAPHVCVSACEEKWRREKVQGYVADSSCRLHVAYLGVWDTVGALGVPARYRPLQFFNRKHRFHDTSLSGFVRRARHAVAIDERRRDFEPTLWDNVVEMNRAAGADPEAVTAPYQQKWFPGVHGAVGGGGEFRGLSDQAMDWVLTGARQGGLEFDSARDSRLYKLRPDATDFLFNSPPPRLFSADWFMNAILRKADRKGPGLVSEVSRSARRRWHEKAENLKDRKLYRPPTLSGVSEPLSQLDPVPLGVGLDEVAIGPFDLYEVTHGDTLGRIAFAKYGDAAQWRHIFQANLDKIDDADLIYIGQSLRIPHEPAGANPG